jgi:hypothetical protein
MPVKNLPLGAGSAIKSEANGDLSRDTVVIAASSGKLAAGTVLGRITTGGKCKAYDNDATDGSQTAIGVLVYEVDASVAVDVPAVAIVRHAEVWKDRLQWASSVAAGEKAPAYVELALAGIIAR